MSSTNIGIFFILGVQVGLLPFLPIRIVLSVVLLIVEDFLPIKYRSKLHLVDLEIVLVDYE